MEVLRVIREVEPPCPSLKLSSSDNLPSLAAQRAIEPQRLTRTIRGELDWVVMKALDKDRERRYGSACLRGDLGKYCEMKRCHEIEFSWNRTATFESLIVLVTMVTGTTVASGVGGSAGCC